MATAPQPEPLDVHLDDPALLRALADAAAEHQVPVPVMLVEALREWAERQAAEDAADVAAARAALSEPGESITLDEYVRTRGLE